MFQDEKKIKREDGIVIWDPFYRPNMDTPKVEADVKEETPPIVEETPPIVEETPPIVEETPPIVEETPPIVEETPKTTITGGNYDGGKIRGEISDAEGETNENGVLVAGKAYIDQSYKDIINDTFSYDPFSDELFQQYQQQYMAGGQLAMKDAMANAAFLSGGYGNSYAATAGQQMYNKHMQGLAGVIPELAKAAYGRWRDERKDKIAYWEKESEENEEELERLRTELSDLQKDAINELIEQCVAEDASYTEDDIWSILSGYNGLFTEEEIKDAIKTINEAVDYYKGEQDAAREKANQQYNTAVSELIEDVIDHPEYMTDAYILSRIYGDEAFAGLSDKDVASLVQTVKDAVEDDVKADYDYTDINAAVGGIIDFFVENPEYMTDSQIYMKMGSNKILGTLDERQRKEYFNYIKTNVEKTIKNIPVVGNPLKQEHYDKIDAFLKDPNATDSDVQQYIDSLADQGYDADSLWDYFKNEYLLDENGEIALDGDGNPKLVARGTNAKNAYIDEAEDLNPNASDDQKKVIMDIIGATWTREGEDTDNWGAGIDRNDKWNNGSEIMTEKEILDALVDAGVPRKDAKSWIMKNLKNRGEK